MAAIAMTAMLAGTAPAAERIPHDARVFRCSPAIVTPAETLVLSKRSPALRELAVFRPGANTPHFLVVDRAPAHMTPVMTPGQLAASATVRLAVAGLSGLEWRVGAEQEPVFTVAGTYRFVLAAVLESEGGAYGCDVEYRPGRGAAP